MEHLGRRCCVVAIRRMCFTPTTHSVDIGADCTSSMKLWSLYFGAAFTSLSSKYSTSCVCVCLFHFLRPAPTEHPRRRRCDFAIWSTSPVFTTRCVSFGICCTIRCHLWRGEGSSYGTEWTLFPSWYSTQYQNFILENMFRSILRLCHPSHVDVSSSCFNFKFLRARLSHLESKCAYSLSIFLGNDFVC